jgi:hypothetical protein
MIPPKPTITVEGSLPVLSSADFSIDDEDFAWIYRMLADAYSDVVMAVIREYATNAWDAQRKIGVTTPIEVTLPGLFNDGMYRVKDNGIGMSMEELLKVYTKFGKSTGRDSNDDNGMLGIGSKSAVAYGTTFDVVSVKDGLRTHAIISRRPDWSIKLDITSQVQTDEPSGTEVIIPVTTDFDEFNHKAKEFFKFWLPGRVLVNGQQLPHAVGNKITEGMYECHAWNTSYIVMNNVPYRINNPSAIFRDSDMSFINFVAYVDGGDVEFTNSREDLKYTDLTRKTLNELVDEFATQIKAEAQKEIDAATSHLEAFNAWRKWGDMLGYGMFTELTYKGDLFNDRFSINGKRYQYGGGRYSTYQISHWQHTNMGNTLIISDFHAELNAAMKTKVRDFAVHKGIDATYFIFTDQKTFTDPWLPKDRIVTWEYVKANTPKKPRKASTYVPGSGRVPGSWDYWTMDGHKSEQPIPAKGDIYWISLRDERDRADVRSLLRAADMKTEIVIIVPANRQAKFLRENPKVKEFLPHIKSLVITDGPSLLSDDAKRAMSFTGNYIRLLNSLDTKEIDDPRWAEDAELLSKKTDLMAKYDANMDFARAAGLWYNVKRYEPQKVYDGPQKEYPLLEQIGGYYGVTPSADLYLYMNAKYAKMKEKKKK